MKRQETFTVKTLCQVMIVFAVLILLSGVAFGQEPAKCPDGMVCISREAAEKVLAEADKAEALEKEAAVKDQAIADLKQIIENLKIEVARMSGEKTQLEADRVRWTAVIDLLLKNTRPKKNGLINF